jgi:hypothetical protein
MGELAFTSPEGASSSERPQRARAEKTGRNPKATQTKTKGKTKKSTANG